MELATERVGPIHFTDPREILLDVRDRACHSRPADCDLPSGAAGILSVEIEVGLDHLPRANRLIRELLRDAFDGARPRR